MNVRRIGRRELEVSTVRVRDPSESSRFRNLLHSLERKALSSAIAGSIAVSAFAGTKTAFAASAVPQQYQNYVQVITDSNTDVSNQLSNDVNNLLGTNNGLYADLGGETVVIDSASNKPITNVSNQNITPTEFNNWASIIMNDISIYFSAPYMSNGGNVPASVQNQENEVSASANNIIGGATASSYYQTEQKVTEAIYGSNLVSSDNTSTQSGSGGTAPTPATPPSTTNKSNGTGSGTKPSSGQGSGVSTSNDIASISLNALPSSENVGTVVTFTGTVYGMDAKPFPNAPVQIVNTNDASGPETLASGSTDSNGTFSVQIDMRNAGTYAIVAQTYNGTNNLDDIKSGPSQIVVNPVFVATPKITIGADAQTSNDTNIAINGSGFTPNGNVNIEWDNIAVLNTAANGKGNFSLQTTASQIVKASNGQLGSNEGINTSIDAIDTASGKASASVPIYLYTKSQSQPAPQTANPDTAQPSNGGNAGSQGSGGQSSGGITQSGQSGAGTSNGNNTSTVQTPTVYVMNADSSKFSGTPGSVSNPYQGWNGWQGQGYYFFANKNLESANIISSTSDAQLYFIAMSGSEAQSPWQPVSGLPQKVNYQVVQNKSQTAATGNGGSSQTNNDGSGNSAPSSSGGNTGSGSTPTTGTQSQGTGKSGGNSGAPSSGGNGITVNIPGPGSGQSGGNSGYIPTTTITNPQTNVSGPTVTEVFKDLKRAYEIFTGTVFPTSMTNNTTEAAKEYIAMLVEQSSSNPVLLIDGWCSAMTGVPSGYDIEIAGIGVGIEYQGYNETGTVGPFKYTFGATGNTLTIGGGVSGSLIKVKATIIPCILTVSASVDSWDLSQTISQNLSRGNILNSEGSITASAADLNLQWYVPGKGGYQQSAKAGKFNANNNGVSGKLITATSKTPASTSTTNIYFNGSESTDITNTAIVTGSGTKSDPYQPNLDDTITWKGNGYYNLTANLPSVYGISPGVYDINKTFAEAYNSWVNYSK